MTDHTPVPHSPRVAALYRYPVKGLSADALDHADLAPGETIPFDRAWAIENGPGRFDPEHPRHLPKITFLMLMRDERLAALETSFEEVTRTLTVSRDGSAVCRGGLDEPTGRLVLEQFFAAYMEDELRGRPRIVSAPGHSFSDTADRVLHVVSLATVQELEREIGRPVDPLRFRPNLVIQGAEPWAELGWVGRELVAGGVRFLITKRTDRCAATNVDPTLGLRNMDIPAVLARRWCHIDFGVYARVVSGGRVGRGDAVTLA